MIYFSCSFSLFPVYTGIGYKNAVKVWYEVKLQEARLEAQQDAQYLLQGDVCYHCMKPTISTCFIFVCKLVIHQIKFLAFFFPFS